MLLQGYGSWFGSPPIEFGGLQIDGRMRFREAVSLRVKVPHAIVARSAGDAAMFLCLGEHYDRARLLVPAELVCAADVAAFCHCAIEVVAPMCRKSRAHPRTVRAYNTARRREAIAGMAMLLRKAETSDGTVTGDQIRKVLAPWL